MCHIKWEICQYWASVLGGSWHKFKVPPHSRLQVAYQNLDGVVFNAGMLSVTHGSWHRSRKAGKHTQVLNQSKVLFTAFFSFLLNGRTGRHSAVCLKDL